MMPEPVNKAGRSIWFAPSRDGGGTYRPVSRAGWMAFLIAAVGIVVCGTVCMIGFALTLDARWFAAMFVAVAIGLGVFAAQVIRHS